jgi:competence protein ComEA
VATSIVAHVAGAVTGPGVVSLPPGARVADAVAAAGGTRPDADLDRVNLAAPIADGGRIYIPTVGGPDVAAVGPSGGEGTEGTAPAQVDLNTATADQLEALPGIGPATAAAILTHRQRSGPFRRVEDLLEVRGIGLAKLEALRDLVVIR